MPSAHRLRRRLRWPTAFACLACLAAATLAACALRPARDLPAMKPSITYLHLLRHTPFFTGLDTQQLRWVIAHSREWEVQAGTVIAGEGAAVDGGAYWILLDGGWTLEYRGHRHASGHADPGQWFHRELLDASARLVAQEHSYVMRIATADMDRMLERGFGFGPHLDEGRAFYGRLAVPEHAGVPGFPNP
jgi:hypothetical protein